MTPTELNELNRVLQVRLGTVARLEENAARLQRNLDAWKEKFAANPLEAFRWSASSIDDAAELELHVQVLAFLKGDVNPTFEGDRLACVRDEFTKDLTRLATFQRWSSSGMTANLVEEAQRVAKAKFLNTLDQVVRTEELRAAKAAK